MDFIRSLIAPNADARIFEIVSYSVLKYYYQQQRVYWGYELEQIHTENLRLFKTGRTNANDGGIDFVMKPLGRFFQVTETVDVKKYFLDIDKVEKYPITFVVKSAASAADLLANIRAQAERQYAITTVVERYMSCIEEIINVPELLARFQTVAAQGYLNDTLQEIIKQSKVEFNYE